MEKHLSFKGANLLLLLLYLCIISGQGGQLVDRGDTTYGGKWVVNPSGGLISKGHPLGATGKKRKKPINAVKYVAFVLGKAYIHTAYFSFYLESYINYFQVTKITNNKNS